MPLALKFVPSAGPPSPVPPEIGTALVATYSLHRGSTRPPVMAVLAIGVHAIAQDLSASEQSDPLPVIFI